MHKNNAEKAASRILVVDDNLLNRKKITRAVKNLGHEAEAVDGGKAAFAALKETAFDAVLLDIIMPEVDGFDVLKVMKGDPEWRDIPVIVISALGGETESVVQAIELGAEDFLPKDFDLVVLKARLSACLTKKDFRDQEKEYYGQIEQLTQAASMLESGLFNPQKLALDEIATHDTPLGRLASVFRGMAGEIFERERKALQTINLLKAGFWILVMSVIYGLMPSLGRMASNLEASPLGLIVWSLSLAGLILLGIASYKGNLPKLTWRNVIFFISWAILMGVIQRTAIFTVSAHIEAALLSLIMTMQGFIVFAFAAFLRMEKATPKRLLGLAIGLAGVSLALGDKLGGSNSGDIVWFAAALLVPLCMAVEVLLMAKYKPKHIDPIAAAGLMLVFSALLVTPFAYSQGELISLSWKVGRLEVVIALLVFITASTYIIAIHIIKIAGAVFYGQSAYIITMAGIIWGMLLLNEEFSPLVWLAFAVIVVGMYLVNPKDDDKELVIKRKFADPVPKASAGSNLTSNP